MLFGTPQCCSQLFIVSFLHKHVYFHFICLTLRFFLSILSPKSLFTPPKLQCVTFGGNLLSSLVKWINSYNNYLQPINRYRLNKPTRSIFLLITIKCLLFWTIRDQLTSSAEKKTMENSVRLIRFRTGEKIKIDYSLFQTRLPAYHNWYILFTKLITLFRSVWLLFALFVV